MERLRGICGASDDGTTGAISGFFSAEIGGGSLTEATGASAGGTVTAAPTGDSSSSGETAARSSRRGLRGRLGGWAVLSDLGDEVGSAADSDETVGSWGAADFSSRWAAAAVGKAGATTDNFASS